MNERIRELAEQATEVSELLSGNCSPDTTDLEKFAELIVKQCIFEVIQRSTKYYSDNYVVQDFTVDVVNDIKDRFGVEE